MTLFGRRIERTRTGRYRLRLSRRERDVLRALLDQLRDALATDDPALRRLTPPAYREDPDREAEYRHMVRGDLLRQRRESLAVMEATIDAESLDQDQLDAWLGALNDLRLVLGTRLEVTEDLYEDGFPDGDPRAPAFELYRYLGWLEEQVVEAAAADLGP